ncbi:MAG: MFS transporter [Hespellia sp.]|nr:MFS transporter [Hespellia sp.]
MSRSKKIKIIISIICISFIQGLQFCVSPILGPIQKHFSDVSISMVQMLVTVPTFLSIIVAIGSGWIVVKISKKKLLLFASAVAGITGFMPFLADSFNLLFVSRIIYGVALGLAMALNTAVVAEFFEGDERVTVMGVQAASVGAGMVVVTTLGGILGAIHFQNAYFVGVIGFIALVVIAACLPETGTAKITKTEKITLNKKVYFTAFVGVLEMIFLITFSTNIAMHISGSLAGSTTVSGNLTGLFAGAQIVMGLILGAITKVTKKYTLPAAMLSFSVGAVLLIMFPSNYVMLMVGAAFCGFSQGMFVPTSMVEVANAVNPASTAMASAVLTCGLCFGQLISPTVLNTASKVILGETTTTNVFILAAIGMAISAVIVIFNKMKNKE